MKNQSEEGIKYENVKSIQTQVNINSKQLTESLVIETRCNHIHRQC